MDLVTGAKRVIVAMQHTAKGASKIVKRCLLPVTATRAVEMVVTELAVIGFANGTATLLETGPGVSVGQVVAATEASLTVPENVPEMQIRLFPWDAHRASSQRCKERAPWIASPRRRSPQLKAKLLHGKRGLIVGIANENSIAWGCAKAFRAFGAELAVTYLNDKGEEIRRAARARVASADRDAA